MSTIHYSASELSLFVAIIIRNEARPGHDLLRIALMGEAELPALRAWWQKRGLDVALAGYAKANAAAHAALYGELTEAVVFSDADLLRAARAAIGLREESLDPQIRAASLLRYNLDDQETAAALGFCLEVMTAANRLLLDRCRL